MQPNIIKIDGSIIASINEDEHSATLAKMLTSISGSMNLKTTAVRVTTEDVYETVKSFGISHAQGLHIGEAVPAKESNEIMPQLDAAPEAVESEVETV